MFVRVVYYKWSWTSFLPIADRPIFSYKLRYIVGSGLVEMAISTNPESTIYRNLYENRAVDENTIYQSTCLASDSIHQANLSACA